ncbi:MAG: caspase family protein [Caldilineaceae bacterium]
MLQREGNRYAIIIGTSDFEDMRLSRLASPAMDAMKLAQILQNRNIGTYDVKMFLNSSSYSVNRAIEGFFDNRRREDTLLLYYSGHGIKDIEGRLYFAASDTQVDLLLSTAVSASLISEMINRSQSKNKILLLDCCYSGAFASNLNSSRRLVAITSSDSIQFSLEEDGSTFSKELIYGLETGDADLNRDGKITIFDLYLYIYQKMKEKNLKQTPKFWAIDIDGDPVLADNPQ